MLLTRARGGVGKGELALGARPRGVHSQMLVPSQGLSSFRPVGLRPRSFAVDSPASAVVGDNGAEGLDVPTERGEHRLARRRLPPWRVS